MHSIVLQLLVHNAIITGQSHAKDLLVDGADQLADSRPSRVSPRTHAAVNLDNTTLRKGALGARIPSTTFGLSRVGFPDAGCYAGRGAGATPGRRLGTRPAATCEEHVAVIWFRSDLRLRDNPLLHSKVVSSASHVLPVYFLDPRHFASNAALHPHWLGKDAGFSKTGIFRTRFLLESLRSLQLSLRALGTDLLIVLGTPETDLPELLRSHLPLGGGGATVLCEHNVGTEEDNTAKATAEALRQLKVELKEQWGSQTLFTPGDLPFKIDALPEPFTKFRQAVENRRNPVPVKQDMPQPRSLPPLPEGVRGTVVSLEDTNAVLKSLGFTEDEIQRKADARAQISFVGGEDAGLSRLKEFVREGLATYKQTRNNLVGRDFSSHLSPWLANGCVSPRTAWWAAVDYEAKHGATDDTYWFRFELMWRDWFRFFAKKHGKAIYFRSGPAGDTKRWTFDQRKFEQWRTGQTGVRFVDANMKELMLTGFMSNRGRQNVASFLIFDLNLDWRLGAQWFEHTLLDHDPASNYGNWACAAGVGMADQRVNKFNIPKQMRDYDPQGEFVDLWLGRGRR